MFSWLKSKCKHPFDLLQVNSKHTVIGVSGDFTEYQYSFHCVRCGEVITKKFAIMNKTVEEFLKGA